MIKNLCETFFFIIKTPKNAHCFEEWDTLLVNKNMPGKSFSLFVLDTTNTGQQNL